MQTTRMPWVSIIPENNVENWGCERKNGSHSPWGSKNHVHPLWGILTLDTHNEPRGGNEVPHNSCAIKVKSELNERVS